MTALRFRYLDRADVVACGGQDYLATIASVEEVLRLLHAGACQEPPGTLMHWEGPHRRRFIAHAAYVGGPVEAAGLKWIGSNPDNPDRGLARATAILILSDPATGLPRAIMEGAAISAARTAAVVAAAAKRLAPGDARVLAVIGAGVIGCAQVDALRAVLPGLARVLIHDIVPERARAAAARLGAEAVGSAEEAVRQADIVAPATNVGTDERYIPAEWVRPGAFLAAVSLNDYCMAVVEAAGRVVVDTRAQLGVRGLLLADMVAAGRLDPDRVETLGQILAGERPPRRPGETVFFSPMGLGVEDVINADRVLREAEARGIGRMLDLGSGPAGCGYGRE